MGAFYIACNRDVSTTIQVERDRIALDDLRYAGPLKPGIMKPKRRFADYSVAVLPKGGFGPPRK